MRVVEQDVCDTIVVFDGTVLKWLPVSAACPTAYHLSRRVAADPMQLSCSQGIAKQQVVIVSLRHGQDIVGEILAYHVPGFIWCIRDTADTQSLALSERVVHQPLVAADPLSLGGQDVTGVGRQVARQEITEPAFADEADPSTVLLS